MVWYILLFIIIVLGCMLIYFESQKKKIESKNGMEEATDVTEYSEEESYDYDTEKDWLTYENIERTVYTENTLPVLPYADEETYEIIKAAYEKIDFYGEFKEGDRDVYDEYKGIFLKLLHNEIPYINLETDEESYFKDITELHGQIEEYDYYFFDLDEDGKPELGVRDVTNQYFFKYVSETEKCVLWHTFDGAWEQWFGSLKLANPWGGGQYMLFTQLDEEKENVIETECFSVWFSEEESLHMVMLPIYKDKQKEVVVTDNMKACGVFDLSTEQWFFRLTDEQYEELTAAYMEAYDLACEERKEVTYFYDELFGSL